VKRNRPENTPEEDIYTAQPEWTLDPAQVSIGQQAATNTEVGKVYRRRTGSRATSQPGG